MKYILGIDVGTTGTKTILFTENGQLCNKAYRSYPLSTPAVGLSEQNSEDWWQAVCETIRELCNSLEVSKNVAAISLSTQGGTLVPTDNDGNALRPAIVWSDMRAEKQKEAFEQDFGGDDIMYYITGWHLCNKLPAMTIRWLRENEPEIFSKAAYFLTVPDYLSMKLTGIPAVDISNAGINQLCNIKEKIYDKRLLDFCGVSEKQLPKIVSSGDLIGHLTEDAANALGLTTETVLVAGAHDQYAAALGAGAINAGDILIGSGTCWVITSISDSPDFDSGLSQSVSAVSGKWGSMQSLSSGGVCLDWLRKQIISETELSYEAINNEISSRRAAEDGLFFYPFTGKSGQNQMFQRAGFIGLDLSHDRFHMALAVMEGIVFQALWMMEAFKAKPSDNGLILAGGASKSLFWVQLVADISGLPVRIPAIPDLACVGAAIIAGIGSGLYENAKNGYQSFAVEEKTIYPNKDNHKKFIPIFEKYKKKAASIK